MSGISRDTIPILRRKRNRYFHPIKVSHRGSVVWRLLNPSQTIATNTATVVKLRAHLDCKIVNLRF